MSDLPLFPLPQSVVFPGQTVPLYVFEARYRRLVRYCLELPRPRFALVLQGSGAPIRDGEPGFHTVGTLVDIVSLTENADGTYHLLAHGGPRCSTEITLTEQVPEPDGTRRPLNFISGTEIPLGRGDLNEEQIAAWDAMDLFRRYARALFSEESLLQLEEALPDDLFYQASFICANLRIPAESRQVLLEAPSLIERFQLARRMISERLAADRSRSS